MCRLTKWALAHNVQLAAVVLLANILVVAAGSISFAEERSPAEVTIELEQGRLRVNGREIVMPSKVDEWVKEIGAYSRAINLGRVCYLWDNVGISLLENGKGKINNFIIEFNKLPKMEWEKKQKQDPEIRETEYCFSGSFLLNGVKLDATMPLWEYNHKVKDNRFYESYTPIIYKVPGGINPDNNHAFGVSARVGLDLRVYWLEVYYASEPQSSPLEDEEETQPSHVEILQSELRNAVDSVKRRLGITPETDDPETDEGNK